MATPKFKSPLLPLIPVENEIEDEDESMETSGDSDDSDESELDDVNNGTGGDNPTSIASSEDEMDDEYLKLIKSLPEAKSLKVAKPNREKEYTKLYHCGYEYIFHKHKYKKGKKLEDKQIWKCVQRTRGWQMAKKNRENPDQINEKMKSLNCPTVIHVTIDTKQQEKRYFIDKIVRKHSHSGDLRKHYIAEVRLLFPGKHILPDLKLLSKVAL